MITKEEKDRVREELELKKRHLIESLDHYSLIPADASRKREEIADAATARILRENNHNASKKMLEDVEAALIKLDDDAWGICIDCDNEISEDRRNAMCWVTRCKPCQEKKGVKVR